MEVWGKSQRAIKVLRDKHPAVIGNIAYDLPLEEATPYPNFG